ATNVAGEVSNLPEQFVHGLVILGHRPGRNDIAGQSGPLSGKLTGDSRVEYFSPVVGCDDGVNEPYVRSFSEGYE
ncbi:MAG: hypothetical protein ACYCUV_04970, partial [Phycisphaerae bacterium]